MQQGRSQSAAAPPSEGSMDCKQWFGTVCAHDNPYADTSCEHTCHREPKSWIARCASNISITINDGMYLHLQVFTNDKAGMAAVDKEKVKKIVYEMSKVG